MKLSSLELKLLMNILGTICKNMADYCRPGYIYSITDLQILQGKNDTMRLRAQDHDSIYMVLVNSCKMKILTHLPLLAKNILNKNTPGAKKGEAKSEAPKVTLIIAIYSTKKIDIMQVEAKACIAN